MQIRELSKPVTSKKLNESLAKKFGYKLNLEKFTEAQLEDVRNKLRTEMSQLEVNESFDNLQESPAYQKTRALLDVINTEIMEREEGKCSECNCNPCECEEHAEHDHKAEKKEAMRKKLQASKMKEKAMEHSVPANWIRSAIQRIELGESDEEELTAELTTRYDLNENTANYIVYLAEGEQDKAEIIMATKDMVDRITGWLEDTAQLKTENLLELIDSIREALGSDVAQQYSEQVKSALEAVFSALEQSRGGLQSALALVSGGEAPTMGAPAGAPPMGAEPAMGGAPMDAGLPPEEEEAPMAGGAAGREKRESVDYSRRLGILLNSKKK
jgi:ABC-type arginine transport system ATPase subunit